MKRLINLTLHEQGSREVEIARMAGYRLETTPLAPVVQAGQAGLDTAGAALADLLRMAARDDAAVLIGGHSGALAYALRILRNQAWPEMVVFDTRRERDDRDRFVFVPIGMQVVPPAEREREPGG